MKHSLPGFKKKSIVKKHKPEWCKIERDGREVLNRDTVRGREEYARRTISVWQKGNELCHYCKRHLDALEVTADHVIPRGMGGGTRDDRESNLVPACWSCNSLKGSRRDFELVP